MNEKKLLDAKGKEYIGEFDVIEKLVTLIEEHWALSAAIFVAGTTVLSFFFDVFLYGKSEYWGIDPQWIETDGNYAVYHIAKKAVVFSIFVLLNFIPYSIVVKNKDKKIFAIMKLLVTIVILTVGVFIAVCRSTKINAIELFSEATVSQIVKLLLFCFLMVFVGLIYGMILGVGQVFHWFEKQTKCSKVYSFAKSHRLISTAIIFFIVVVIEVFLVSYLGKSIAESQKEYEIIDNHYVVLGENNGNYICSPIKSIDNNVLTIDKSKHIVISEQDIETETRSFSEVSKSVV
jgi:hypothetical protein